MNLANLPWWESHRLLVQDFSKFNVNTDQLGLMLTCRTWFSYFEQSSQFCISNKLQNVADAAGLQTSLVVLVDHPLICSGGGLLWHWHALPLPCPTKYIWRCSNPILKSEYCKYTYQIWWKSTLGYFTSFLCFSVSKDRQSNFIYVDKVFYTDL